jgi:hypothetical protein
MHDITKQPQWVQELLADKDKEIERTKTELKHLQVAHSVLMNREWFTIPNPIGKNGVDVRYLFTLHTNCAAPVCSIGRGDTLLVGRAKRSKAADPYEGEQQQ